MTTRYAALTGTIETLTSAVQEALDDHESAGCPTGVDSLPDLRNLARSVLDVSAISSAQATALAGDDHLRGRPRTDYALHLLVYTSVQTLRASGHLTTAAVLLGSQDDLSSGDDRTGTTPRLPLAEVAAAYEAAAVPLREARTALAVSADIGQPDFTWHQPTCPSRPWGDIGSPPPEPVTIEDHLHDLAHALFEAA